MRVIRTGTTGARQEFPGVALPPWSSLMMHPGAALFLASFLSLFLELLLIRWVPSLVRVVAYYGNLMLLSSFLGLGCGAILARRGLKIYRWFSAPLLLLILVVSSLKGMEFRQGPDELRFLFIPAPTTTAFPVVFIFVLNALTFVPLGDLIGSYFQKMPPLKAYSWDLGGAIAGTLLFGLFSFFWFSPILASAFLMTLYLLYCVNLRQLVLSGVAFACSLAVMVVMTDRSAVWSPYNYLTIREFGSGDPGNYVSAPAENIGARLNPPLYLIEVNRDTYQLSGTIDLSRYTEADSFLRALREQFALPHLIRPGTKDVLVVGAGSGKDVEAALLAGAKRVDAVEIDPALIRLAHQYNASQAYRDARVSVHNTDARAFFRRTDKKYDMVVFGFLDSQGLFSQMSNIRLDSYVYTRESFQEAFGLLKDGGLLSVSFFFAGKIWLIDRLVAMVRSATHRTPSVYIAPEGQVIILAGKGLAADATIDFEGFRPVQWKPLETPEADDDWPYLYLRKRFIPIDYLNNVGVLIAISLVFVLCASRGGKKGIDSHFFFLGAGFLLLETKSITTISLYFGTTWLVSTVVILGVLLMVLFANLVASRLAKFSLKYYWPLIASVGFLYFFPTQSVLAWPFILRLAYSVLVIPLPIFFAGLIFSLSFRESGESSFCFGSNLLGAMVGGFGEYLGMITGMKTLLLVVLAFYLSSLLIRIRSSGN